jgi:hypothetical protein
MRVTILLSVLFALSGGACSSSTPSTCIPGASSACACTDGEQGAQTCNASRTYDPCVCSPPPHDDAGSDASAFPSGWECLGSPAPTADGGTVEIRYVLLNATDATSTSSGTPIVGTTIQAFMPIDFSCANPLDSTATDDAGAAILPLPSGFAGYYEVPSAPGFNPTLFFRPPQYVDQTQPQGMPDSMDLSAAGQVAGVTQDPTLGFAIVGANDCNGNSAGGITFAVGNPGPNETVVYLLNSIPSTAATQTDRVTGSALIFNVPANPSLAVSAFFASSGMFIQKITALGRAGWVSYVAIQPDQATRPPF